MASIYCEKTMYECIACDFFSFVSTCLLLRFARRNEAAMRIGGATETDNGKKCCERSKKWDSGVSMATVVSIQVDYERDSM